MYNNKPYTVSLIISLVNIMTCEKKVLVMTFDNINLARQYWEKFEGCTTGTGLRFDDADFYRKYGGMAGA